MTDLAMGLTAVGAGAVLLTAHGVMFSRRRRAPRRDCRGGRTRPPCVPIRRDIRHSRMHMDHRAHIR